MSDSMSAFGRPCPDTLPVIDGRKSQAPVVEFKDIALNFQQFVQAVNAAVRYEHVGKKPRAAHIAWTVLRFCKADSPSWTTIGKHVHREQTTIGNGVRNVTMRAVFDDRALFNRIAKIARHLERDGWNIADIGEGMNAAAKEWKAREEAPKEAKKKPRISQRKEIAVTREYRKGETMTAICARHNMHRTTFLRILKKRGVPQRTRAQSWRLSVLRARAERAA